LTDLNPKVLQGTRRKGAIPLPPSDVRIQSSLFLLAGIALCVAGWVDLGFFWWPLGLGNPDWEIGTIGQTIDSLPVGTVGLMLLALAIRNMGWSRIWTRVVSAILLLVGLFCVGCLVIMTLDMPQVVRAIHNATTTSGIKRGVFKVYLFGLTYAAAYFLMAFVLWRSTSRHGARASEVEAPAA